MNPTDALQLEEKKNFFLQINALREKIRSYKFVHVLTDDKFTKSIVDFINNHFSAAEHCFVYFGAPDPRFPKPTGENILWCPALACLAVSDKVDKVIFHGLYNGIVVRYLYEQPDILQKSYWIPWGWDLYEAPDDPVHNHVRRNFQGYACFEPYTQKIYEQKYGKGKIILPFRISFESIPYKTILATQIPKKDYIQIQVNNSAHKSTLEVFANLRTFAHENIRVITILSYGKQEYCDAILDAGQKIFGDKFSPIMNYLPPDAYIKVLARNDIYILNQQRPQGLTTAFTSLLLGAKVFMRGELAGHFREDGYTFYDTATLAQVSFSQLLENTAKEKNRCLATQRFDENCVKQCWQNIFEYK